MRAESLATQQLHGLDGHDAVGAAAVCDDIAVPRQLSESLRQIAHGNRAGTGNVAGRVLLDGTNVEQRDLAPAHASQEFVAIDGLELAGPVRWGTTPSLQGPASVPVRIRR